MSTREPVVAGQFYPGDRQECLAQVRECLETEALPGEVPGSIVGGIVPHAGWTFSGAVAGLVFRAIAECGRRVETFVICGTAHGYFGPEAADDENEAWSCPLGEVSVDVSLREKLVRRGVVTVDPAAHRGEHSIEVQIPFLVHLFPAAKILPLTVPPTHGALALGEVLGEVVRDSGQAVVFIGSTDLTHYGPRYGFTPMGAGSEGLHWAKEVNDRAFIDWALELDSERLLAGAIENGNACGPGAAAATIGAARQLGANRGVLLAHLHSNDVLLRRTGSTSRDSVGYAAIVF